MASIAAFTIVLPAYETPRNAWREKIHAAVARRLEAERVSFSADVHLSVEVCLYMSESMLGFHDVDNRLKDVLDALQGRAGGPKAVRRLHALVPNDNQIFGAVVEKVLAPANDQSGGRLTLRVIGTPNHGAV